MQPRAVLSDYFLSEPPSALRGGGGKDDGIAFIHSPPPFRGIAHVATAAGCMNMCAGERALGQGENTNLQEQLRLAIEEERYEDAAKIRDAIKAQPQSSGGGSRGGVDEEVSGGREEASDVRERLRQREISRLRDIDTGGDNMGTPF